MPEKVLHGHVVQRVRAGVLDGHMRALLLRGMRRPPGASMLRATDRGGSNVGVPECPQCADPSPGRKGGYGDVVAQGTTSTQVPPGDSRIRGQAGAILLSDLGEQRQICIEAAGDEGLIACALVRRDALEDVNAHRTVNFVSVGRFRILRTLLPVQVRRLWPRHCWHSGLLKKSDCKRVVRLCPRPRRRLWRLMRSTTLHTHRRPVIGAWTHPRNCQLPPLQRRTDCKTNLHDQNSK